MDNSTLDWKTARTAPFNRFYHLSFNSAALVGMSGGALPLHLGSERVDALREHTTPLSMDKGAWLFNPINEKHFFIVNRLTGLPLCMSSDIAQPNSSAFEAGTPDLRALLFELEMSDPDWPNYPKSEVGNACLKIVNAELSGDGRLYFGTYDPVYAEGDTSDYTKSFPAYLVMDESKSLEAVRQCSLSGNSNGGKWLLERARTSLPVHDDYTLDIAEIDDAHAYSSAALGMIQGIAISIGSTASMFGATDIGLVAFAVRGAASIGESIREFIETGEMSKQEDPIEVLYRTIMPEIREMLGEAIIEDNVTDASGNIKSAAMEFRKAAKAMDLKAHELLALALEAGEDVNSKGEVAFFDKLEHRDQMRLDGLLSNADNWFTLGLAHLMLAQNAEAGISVFLPSAAQHVACCVLLSILYPEIDGASFGDVLQVYAEHVEDVFETLRGKREAAVQWDDHVQMDTYFGDDRIVHHFDSYLKLHLVRMVDIDLNNLMSFAQELRNMQRD